MPKCFQCGKELEKGRIELFLIGMKTRTYHRTKMFEGSLMFHPKCLKEYLLPFKLTGYLHIYKDRLWKIKGKVDEDE